MVRTLTQTDKINLRNFKYVGADLSLTYKYVLSPLAQFCVDYLTPVTMAPNLITFTGLLFPLFSLFCTLLFDPTLTNGPRWIYLNTGVCMLVYQTLDNMDGKQARKTGSSSALGMLFDHGCDAINAALSAITMASVLGAGWSPALLFVCFCGYVPFYVETWEQCYVGGLFLPIVNGPNEGLIVAATACFVSFLHGPQWWHEETSIVMPEFIRSLLMERQIIGSDRVFFEPFDLMFVFIGGAVVGTVAMACYHVVHHQREHKESVVEPFYDLLPFLVSFLSHTYWVANTPMALQEYPLTTMALMTSVFVDITFHLMVLYMCKRAFEPFSHHTAWASLAFPLNMVLSKIMYGPDSTDMLLDETFLLFALTWVSLALCCVSAYKFLTDIAEALDIFVFQLGKRSSQE